jgi:1-deoxy-D-xylulose-5-phosphate reductoisomerase
MKNIFILGSTGSIGTQALEVIKHLGRRNFKVVGLSTRNKSELFKKQIRKFKPKAVIVSNLNFYDFLSASKTKTPEIYCEVGDFEKVLKQTKTDLVLNAIAGSAGLSPTISAIKAGVDVALANKESLVMAGEIIMREARKKKVKILPVDSEHSAIWQLSQDEKHRKHIKRVILTCSGGPFFGKSRKFLEKVTVQMALKHPKWKMGPKISIDSATLMNKGLEVIEASHLFNLKPEQIDVVIHPESIVHSFVEYVDGSVEAEMAMPDMHLPIQYALTYPEREKSQVKKLNLADIGKFTFYKSDLKNFPCLGLALKALKIGGTAPAVLNAANEAAVDLFLAKRIKFLDIAKISTRVMREHKAIKNPKLKDILKADKLARKKVIKLR